MFEMELLFGSIKYFFPLIVLLFATIKVVNEYERGVVFRLGRMIDAKKPGLNIIVPFVDKLIKVDMRVITLDVPPQDIITHDNVTIKVNAVVYFRVVDPNRALVEVENYLIATSKLAQTTLRSVVGQVDLDSLLASRDQINQRVQSLLDAQTGPWGVKVTNVEIKQVDLPVEMQRAMAKQAEAERERRAKIIAAEGELQASHQLSQAAAKMEESPLSIQLRYLQTLREMSNERAMTIVVPLPMDLINSYIKKN